MVYGVKAEQARLSRTDVIVLQFQAFWYSVPSLLKRWMKETFQHGVLHGRTGDKLKGEMLVPSLTTGAPEALFRHDGSMDYTIDEFLLCFKATCRLRQIEFAGCVYAGGVSYGSRTTPELMENQKAVSVKHDKRRMALLKTL